MCPLEATREGGATILPKMDSETRAADKINQERDQLLEQFFEAVNDLCPPYRGNCIRVKTVRLVDVKRKITQLDPS